MANTLAPFGFRQIGITNGVAPNFGLATYKIQSNNTTAIYCGDPVMLSVDGYVDQWTASTAVSQLVGIFVSCKYYNTAIGQTWNSNYWPGANASGTVTAYVIPCLFAGVAPLFLAQSDGTALTQADVGANFDVTIGTGSTTTGFSGASIDVSTIATTATLPFRLVGLYSDIEPNAPNGADDTTDYNWGIVAANVSGAGSTGLTT